MFGDRGRDCSVEEPQTAVLAGRKCIWYRSQDPYSFFGKLFLKLHHKILMD